MRIRPSQAILLAVLPLLGCATPGNYTWYEVPCSIGDSAIRSMLKDMASNIATTLNKPQKPTWGMDDSAQLRLYIELASDFMNGPTSVDLRWVTGNRGYEISISQQFDGGETADIRKARVAIEAAISKSACPAFNRRIEHSRTMKYT
jgi:hypothetical protein